MGGFCCGGTQECSWDLGTGSSHTHCLPKIPDIVNRYYGKPQMVQQRVPPCNGNPGAETNFPCFHVIDSMFDVHDLSEGGEYFPPSHDIDFVVLDHGQIRWFDQTKYKAGKGKNGTPYPKKAAMVPGHTSMFDDDEYPRLKPKCIKWLEKTAKNGDKVVINQGAIKGCKEDQSGVKWAGEAKINGQGKMYYFDNASGHFIPSSANGDAVAEALNLGKIYTAKFGAKYAPFQQNVYAGYDYVDDQQSAANALYSHSHGHGLQGQQLRSHDVGYYDYYQPGNGQYIASDYNYNNVDHMEYMALFLGFGILALCMAVFACLCGGFCGYFVAQARVGSKKKDGFSRLDDEEANVFQ